MSSNCIISDKGWRAFFVAPPTGISNRAARLGQVEQVFTLLRPVCRPLVLQAGFCMRDEIGLPVLFEGTEIARAGAVPEHVHTRPTVAGPIPTSAHTNLSPSGIQEWLRNTRPADTDECIGDWESLVTLSTEVRAFVEGQTLQSSEFPRPITSHGYGSETWFAGPTGEQYFARKIPIVVDIGNELAAVEVEITRHWSFVEPSGRPEVVSLERVFCELENAGFVWKNKL